MYIIVCAILVGLTVAAHEVAHAVYMAHAKIPIKEMSFGIKLWPRFTIRSKRLGFPIYISPYIIYAYVLADDDEDEKILALPYDKQVHIYGAGVMANWCLGLILIIGAVTSVSISLRSLGNGRLVVIVSGTALLLLSIRFFKPICQRGLGWLSLVVAVIVPLEYFLMGELGMPILRPDRMFTAVMMAGWISINLAFLNLLPFQLLDGGKVLWSWARDRYGEEEWKVFDNYREWWATFAICVFVFRWFIG